jgi:putative ABC transport system permease protein
MNLLTQNPELKTQNSKPRTQNPELKTQNSKPRTKIMNRYFFNFVLAVEGVNANKLRSVLTALGIVFGVGAVIAMLAIGAGAKKAILDQMKLIGTNNIVINSFVPSEKESNEEEEGGSTDGGTSQNNNWAYSPGLTLEDLQAIEKVLSNVERISPEVILPTNIVRSAKMDGGRVIGITNSFFELNRLTVNSGSEFHSSHLEEGEPVCIIGKNIKSKFFSEADPIGQKIKCGNTWMTVIGVIEKRLASRENLNSLGIRDYNSDIYIPVTTALRRFKNRAKVSQESFGRSNNNSNSKQPNYHQLDRATIRIVDSKQLQASADVVARMLIRRHREVLDFEIQIPELLLEQEQKTQDTFNLVLAVIAGISLLVGGIGIMNIMLASVMERIKEIGVRRSLGATQKDIILQFLFEAIIISLIGGALGILIGLGSARTIAAYADIPTVVSGWSVFLSFGVAATVGLIFGLFPAQKAAKLDPIKALRSD